jgi:hypothetical protein
MRKIGSRIVSPLSALLLAASLAFGASTVFAQPQTQSNCNMGYGTCTQDSTCQQRCDFYGGYPIGACENGCCVCLF